MKMPPHAWQIGPGVLVVCCVLVFFLQTRAWGAGPLPSPSLPEQQQEEEPTPVPAPAAGLQPPSAQGPFTPVEFEQRRIPRPTSPTPAAPPAAPVVLPPPVAAPPPPP